MGERRIEDYALLSDCRSAALVSRAGAVEWLCFPRFDSPACFASLLGSPDNGRWEISPIGEATSERRYLPGSLILETRHTTSAGSVVVTDALVPTGAGHRLVRSVEGESGAVAMRCDMRIRFDYGSVVPWVTRAPGGGLRAIAGPEALMLRTGIELHGEDHATVGEFTVRAGQRADFDLSWNRSHLPSPEGVDVPAALEESLAWWRQWSSGLTCEGAHAGEMRDSLVVLKGLSHAATGSFVAAATTSLPEWIGGVRNWDYRYCWLRDATFTLVTLVRAGRPDDARAWRDWMVRAVAGDPSRLQIMYGPAGERRLPEQELAWLDGFAGSRPVRIGNGAAAQRQLDVYGEVMDALHQARIGGLPPDGDAWKIQRAMMEWLEGNWQEPDEGIWEVRSGSAQFTHSKVMCWVAFDRAVRAVEEHGLDGDADRWRALRDQVHAEVLARAVDDRGVFTQSYGSRALDAATLMIPLVGFLPPDDPRVTATVEAIRSELTVDGLVRRYAVDRADDGVGGREGTFLICSFWLVDCLAMMGRTAEAQALFSRLLGLRNDVGLLAEQFDPLAGRQLGNFPQAYSHLAIVGSAMALRPATAAGELPGDGPRRVPLTDRE